MGAAMGLGSGIGGAIEGFAKKSKANRMEPPMEDVQQRAILEDIRRKRRNMEMGVGTEASQAKDLVGRNLAQTQRNVLRASAGRPGTAMQGLAMASRAAGDLQNKALANQSQMANYYAQLQQQAVNDMAQRRLYLERQAQAQKQRESAEALQGAMQNFAGGLSYLTPGMFAKNDTAGMFNMDTTGSTPTANIGTSPSMTGMNLQDRMGMGDNSMSMGVDRSNTNSLTRKKVFTPRLYDQSTNLPQ
jgi:hypothetical protein